MKYVVISLASLLILLSLNCNEGGNKIPKFFLGYAIPGDFRATGIAPEKTYSLFTGTAWQQACVPASQKCNAVYTYWFTKQPIITEGFAINDKKGGLPLPPLPKFNMKIYHVAGFPAWDAYITLNGATYSGIISDSDMTITKTLSSADTYPAYTAADGTALPASGVKIRLVTITFQNNVQLCATPITGPCITINAGDFITAVDDSWF